MTAILPTNHAGVVTADTIRQAAAGVSRLPARMTTTQVARRAGVSPKAVSNWVRTGKLVPIEPGGSGVGNGHIFSGADVAAFLAQRAGGAA